MKTLATGVALHEGEPGLSLAEAAAFLSAGHGQNVADSVDHLAEGDFAPGKMNSQTHQIHRW